MEDRQGYCDLHLECRLVAAGTWLAGQYGGDVADCNPFEYWRCSRQECSRCYDPAMYGYFDLDRTPGGRIQMNPRKQERCGRHAETPFMCVGRFGQRRQFRCPFRGCDNVGSLVAEFVANVEEADEKPPAEASSLTGDAKKEAIELAVFSEFAEAANLQVASARNARPPLPDIRCTLDGEDYWFELGRITDTNLAKRTSVKWPDDPKPFSFLQEEPFLRIIEKKAKAKYETNGRPVDLVLHFDQQPPDHTAFERYIRKHADGLDELRRRGPFARVWIYDGWSKSVLWSSQISCSPS